MVRSRELRVLSREPGARGAELGARRAGNENGKKEKKETKGKQALHQV